MPDWKVWDQQSYIPDIPVAVAYPADPSSNYVHMTTVLHGIPHRRFIKIKGNPEKRNFIEWRLQFSGSNFIKRDSVKTTIQFMRERQSRHLKKWFFANDGPIYFYINGTIWQTLFHGINFIFRIKLKKQTENLKFQPVHFYVTTTGYKKKNPWKFTSDDII